MISNVEALIPTENVQNKENVSGGVKAAGA
jgi:hypothetical protein